MINLNGLYTALVTPFGKNGNIDFKALEKLISLQQKAIVSGIVLFGTTGESPTVNQYEKFKVIDFVSEILNNKTSLIIGAGSNDTSKTLNEVKGLSGTKADAILLATPAYSKPTANGLYSHFKRVADESYKPIILYNVPSRSGVNIPLEVIEKLKTHPNIIGIKDAGGNMDYSLKLVKLASNDFILLSGNDNLTLPLMSLGYSGVISVASNFLPNEMNFFVNRIQKGDYRTARILQNFMLDIMNACFIESNPIPVKYVMYKLGLIENKLRLPLTPLSAFNRKKIINILKNMQFIGDTLCVE